MGEQEQKENTICYIFLQHVAFKGGKFDQETNKWTKENSSNSTQYRHSSMRLWNIHRPACNVIITELVDELSDGDSDFQDSERKHILHSLI